MWSNYLSECLRECVPTISWEYLSIRSSTKCCQILLMFFQAYFHLAYFHLNSMITANYCLTHHGPARKHKCIDELGCNASGNNLFSIKPLPEPVRAYCWSTSKIWIKVQNFSFKLMYLKMSSAKCQPCCWCLTLSNPWPHSMRTFIVDMLFCCLWLTTKS